MPTTKITSCFQRLAYIPKRHPATLEQCFYKTIVTAKGEVKIKVSNVNLDLLPRPKAYVVQLPEALQHVCLPHLTASKSICYLDDESTTVSLLDSDSAIATFVTAIEARVMEWGAPTTFDKEIQAEFSNYWQPERIAFCVGLPNACGESALYERKQLNGGTIHEIVVGETRSELNDWIAKRSGFHVNLGTVLFIALRQPPYVPWNMNWPPSSLVDVFAWLKETDNSAFDSFVHKIVRDIDSMDFTVCLKFENEYIGFIAGLTGEGLQYLKRIKRTLTQGNHSRRKTTRNRIAGFKPTEAANRLGVFGSHFSRLRIDLATPEFIFGRNNPTNKTIVGKRVALIGCGTIGSYAGQLLAQIGAGATTEFHLFDDDLLTTANLGRHLLGIEYVGEVKSVAMAEYLLQQHLVTKVSRYKQFTQQDLKSRFDIIVDATGDTAFSMTLARWAHALPLQRRPLIVHSWVDGYGFAARALRDNGTSGCFGCLFHNVNGLSTPRFPLFAKGNEPEHASMFRRNCGKTYLPFNTQASVTAAGLIQQLLLGSTETFLQISLSSSVRKINNQILQRSSTCPICSPSR